MITWAKSIAITSVAFFAPVYAIIGTTVVFVLLDTITGILLALKLKKRITSRKLSRAVAKMLVYSLTICLAFALQKVFAPEFPIQNMATSLIGLSEVLSILENLNGLSHTKILDRIIDALKKNDDKE